MQQKNHDAPALGDAIEQDGKRTLVYALQRGKQGVVVSAFEAGGYWNDLYENGWRVVPGDEVEAE